MAGLGYAGRLLRRLASVFDDRTDEHSARVAIRTAQLVISSAADNSLAIASAIGAMLRHADSTRGQLRSDLVEALREARNHTHDKSLKFRIEDTIAKLQGRPNPP